ncbi:MAG: hypothetical protein EOO42_21860, partial [Flavobacteriales bacterium]
MVVADPYKGRVYHRIPIAIHNVKLVATQHFLAQQCRTIVLIFAFQRKFVIHISHAMVYLAYRCKYNPPKSSITTALFNDMIEIKNNILKIITKINGCLVSQNRQQELGLLGGLAGDTLFHLAYFNLTKNEQQLELALKNVNAIYNHFDLLKRNGLTLSGGVTGFAWLLQYIKELNYLDMEVEEMLTEFDNLFHNYMLAEANNGHYDYLHGALGIGSYYLMRYQIGANAQHLENLVLALDANAKKTDGEYKWLNRNPENRQLTIGEYNLGLAHGIPSILLFLIK